MRDAAQKGVLIYGECGGYMTLGKGLVDASGTRHEMLGLLPLETSFASRRLHLGYREAQLGIPTPFGPAGMKLRGHEFHRWQLSDRPADASPWRLEGWGVRSRVEGWTDAAVHASWLHLHWGGCPSIPQRLMHAAGKLQSA